ncbi:MAG: site-specific integrase [Lachnospiraceae bacterium]|nr:site-specific integrase [Lachnospiraceae bacterium]
MSEEMIAKNPVLAVKPIKIRKELRMPFSQMEIDILQISCSSVKMRTMLELFLSSGARVNEISCLDVMDLDLEKRVIHIREGKGNKERIAYISDVAAYYLREYLQGRTERNTPLFFGNPGKRMKANGIEKAMKQLGKRAGVENVHPHRFRRTLATTLARRGGMPVQQIQQILGHANISVTMRYIYTADSDIESAYNKCI